MRRESRVYVWAILALVVGNLLADYILSKPDGLTIDGDRTEQKAEHLAMGKGERSPRIRGHPMRYGNGQGATGSPSNVERRAQEVPLTPAPTTAPPTSEHHRIRQMLRGDDGSGGDAVTTAPPLARKPTTAVPDVEGDEAIAEARERLLERIRTRRPLDDADEGVVTALPVQCPDTLQRLRNKALATPTAAFVYLGLVEVLASDVASAIEIGVASPITTLGLLSSTATDVTTISRADPAVPRLLHSIPCANRKPANSGSGSQGSGDTGPRRGFTVDDSVLDRTAHDLLVIGKLSTYAVLKKDIATGVIEVRKYIVVFRGPTESKMSVLPLARDLTVHWHAMVASDLFGVVVFARRYDRSEPGGGKGDVDRVGSGSAAGGDASAGSEEDDSVTTRKRWKEQLKFLYQELQEAADVQDSKSIARINAQISRLNARINAGPGARRRIVAPTPEPLSADQEEKMRFRAKMEQEMEHIGSELQLIEKGKKFATYKRQKELVNKRKELQVKINLVHLSATPAPPNAVTELLFGDESYEFPGAMVPKLEPCVRQGKALASEFIKDAAAVDWTAVCVPAYKPLQQLQKWKGADADSAPTKPSIAKQTQKDNTTDTADIDVVMQKPRQASPFLYPPTLAARVMWDRTVPGMQYAGLMAALVGGGKPSDAWTVNVGGCHPAIVAALAPIVLLPNIRIVGVSVPHKTMCDPALLAASLSKFHFPGVGNIDAATMSVLSTTFKSWRGDESPSKSKKRATQDIYFPCDVFVSTALWVLSHRADATSNFGATGKILVFGRLLPLADFDPTYCTLTSRVETGVGLSVYKCVPQEA